MLCKIKPVVNLNEKENKTLMFAAKELQRYLRMVIDEEIPVIATKEYVPCEGVLFLGTELTDKLPDVADKKLDDAICIDCENFSGFITGTNARAVLIAVYRFLKEKGYKFIRPGVKGEFIPKSVNGDRVSVLEKPSYRHRCICLEGGVFQENFNDIIDWLPKAAMNEYLVQFQLPVFFLDRWYGGKNPYKKSEPLTKEEIAYILKDAEDEIEKRSIIYHGVGHGWTCEAFGIEGTFFGASNAKLTEEQKSIIAMVDGKREMFGGSPMNTNLCYSRPDVRSLVTDNIVKYLEKHTNLDYLHFWLADDKNNHCECENCRDTRPTDYYVMMLNELDEKLTAKGIKTRIVFCMYRDTLWKPEKTKIKNEDRFLAQFAPISRSYSRPYDASLTGVRHPYVRNKLAFSDNIGDCFEYLRDWQTNFTGEIIAFEYCHVGDQYFDFGQYNLAKILNTDITQLEPLGLNGWVSCQTHRAFAPTSLGMNILAQTLWNKEKPFEETEEEVLKAEFGNKWEIVRDYIRNLSENGYAKYTRRDEKLDSATAEAKLALCLKAVKDIRPEIESGLNSEYKDNWDKLDFCNNLFEMLCRYFFTFGSCESDALKEKIIDYAYKNEEKYRDVFDAGLFVVDNFSGMAVEWAE